MNRSAGFTLLEVLLSVTIIGILLGLSVPVYETFVRRNDLDITTQSIAVMLRRAEVYARSVKSDNAWGVAIQSGVVTLFQGTNFAGRDTAFDETLTLPGTVTPSGLSEVQFAKFTALPNTTGNITLTSTETSIRTININAKGTIDY